MTRDNEFQKYLNLKMRVDAGEADDDLLGDICDFQDYAISANNDVLFDELEILRNRVGGAIIPDWY